MLGLLEEDHHEERRARGKVAQMPRAKHFHCRREWMPHDCLGRICRAKSKADQRKEGVLLVAPVDRRSASRALIEARPHLECRATDRHVASRSDSAESTDVEPVGRVTIHNETAWAIVRESTNLCEKLFGVGLEPHRNRPPANRHHFRVSELFDDGRQPSLFRNRVVIEIGDDIRAGDQSAAISGSRETRPFFAYVTRAKTRRQGKCLAVAIGRIVDDDDVERRKTLFADRVKAAGKVICPANGGNNNRAAEWLPVG